MTANMEKLGTLLGDARKRRGMTLRQVEQAAGISNAYLSQLENGYIQSPSPVILHKLSQEYGISYSSVMEVAGYPIPPEVRPDTLNDRLAARIGTTTPEEEDAIVEYLRFIRSQRNRRGRP